MTTAVRMLSLYTFVAFLQISGSATNSSCVTSNPNFCSGASLEVGAAAKAKISGALNVSLSAVKYYESLRGNEMKKLDEQIYKALQSDNPGKSLNDWLASPEFVAYAQSIAYLSIPTFLLLIVMLFSFIPLCSARCCWVCKGDEAGSTCGGCCGPDNCCYPRRSATEYTACSPCGGKAAPVVFWLIFALIALAMACVSVVNSAAVVNSVSAGVCVMGDLGADMTKLSGKFKDGFGGVSAQAKKAIQDSENFKTGPIAKTESNLAAVKSSCEAFICKPTDAWDKAGCSKNAAGLWECPDQQAKCNAAGGSGQYGSVCCIWEAGTGAAAGSFFTPDVAMNALPNTDSSSATGMAEMKNKVDAQVDKGNEKLKDVEKKVDDAKTDVDKRLKSVSAFSDEMQGKMMKLGTDLSDGTCSMKEAMTVVNQYTYLGASADHALEFLSILFGLIGIVCMYICKPQSAGAVYPQTAKAGVCCMRCSWVFAIIFMLLYGFIGFAPVFLSVAVGDSCYVIKRIPSDFNGYLGKIIPSVSLDDGSEGDGTVELVPALVLQKCYDGDPIFDALPIQIADFGDMVKWDDLENLDFKVMDTDTKKKWDEDKAKVSAEVPAGSALLTKMATLDTNLYSLDTQVADLKGKDLDVIKKSIADVGTKLEVVKAIDCKFIKRLYDGLAGAMCNGGLEGALWIAITMVIIGWCGFPMMVCAIIINIRLGAVGQRGAWTRGLIADMDSAAQNGNDLKKDGDNFTEVQMTSGNYNLP